MAKTLYFQSGPATAHRGVNDTMLAGAASWWEPRLLAEVRGAGAATVNAASIAGTTVGIEFLNGTVALEWLSEPLSADFTISGTITLNLWGFESTMNDNTAINAVIEKVDGATGAVTQIAKTARVTELAVTTAAVNNFTVTPTSTACKRGDRIRVRPFIDDIGVAMVVGTSTFSYNGTTAAAAGDSYVTFTETLTFETATPTGSTYYLTSSNDALAGTAPALISDFTGADENPLSEGGNWAKLNSTWSALQRISNTVTGIAGDSAGSYWTPANFGPDLEAYVTLSALATTFRLYARIQGEGGAGTFDGYSVAAGAGSSTTTINRHLNAATTPILSSVPITSGPWGTGDKLGIRCVGSTIQVWRQASGSSIWNLAGSVTDTTYASAGKIAMFVDGTTERVDDLYAATGSALFTQKAATTRGSASTTAATATVAGPTGGVPINEWHTPALEAVTLGGKAKFNIRALESNALANASLKAEVAVTAGDGTGATVWGTANVEPSTTAGELGTSDAAFVAWVAGDDTSVTAGQRLRFRLYVDDIASGPLVTGYTVTVSYNGTTAAAAGDTYVILPVTVVEQSSGTAWTQPVDDTLSLSDAATTESGRTASVPDTLAVADATTFEAAFARTVPDTLAIADAQTVASDIVRAIVDTLSLADATALERGITQPVADTLTLADLAATAAGKGATVNDTVALTDAVRFDQALTVADTVALTDITAQAEEIHISDTLALSDLCDPVKTTGGVALTQPVADTVGVADALAFDRAQTIPDTLAVADTLSSQAVLQRALADSVAMADSLAYQAVLLRAVADTLALTDLCDPVKSTGAVDWAQPIADTVAIADAVAAAFDRGLTVTDTLTLADAASTTSSILRTITDTLAIVDALTTTGSGAQSVADTVTVTDLVRLDRSLVLADVVAVADQLVTQAAVARSIADTLALADSTVAQRGRVQALADTLAVTDTLVFAFERQLAFADTVSPTDLLAFQAVLQRILTDTVYVVDELFSDSVVPLPLPPGWIVSTTGGYITSTGRGQIRYGTDGEIAAGTRGVLARTGG